MNINFNGINGHRYKRYVTVLCVRTATSSKREHFFHGAQPLRKSSTDTVVCNNVCTEMSKQFHITIKIGIHTLKSLVTVNIRIKNLIFLTNITLQMQYPTFFLQACALTHTHIRIYTYIKINVLAYPKDTIFAITHNPLYTWRMNLYFFNSSINLI